MNIVEKAAEKLRAAQLEPEARTERTAAAPVHVAPLQAAPTVERLQERQHVAEPPASPAPPLWHVEQNMLRRLGAFPSDDAADWQLTDELRRVKRPLLDVVAGKGAKMPVHPARIMVASAAPKEGKTFTAVNLALSLARERDFEILLVDGDTAKSDITRTLGLEGRPGLMDVLVDDQHRPADIIVRTDVPNLSVVPAGTQQPLAPELFGSQRMEHVLAGLDNRGARQRLLVFDSSPLLAASDSQVLLTHMGQIVMVVAAGRTRQQEVRQALASTAQSQYVGLILNMSRLPATENRYGQYGQYHVANR
jgi:exopolysaccharide/PEP-CTERM locus tyrosine autokinase